MDNEFINNKLYCSLRPTDLPTPRFSPVPIAYVCPIVSFSGSLLYNLNKYIANTPKIFMKIKKLINF